MNIYGNESREYIIVLTIIFNNREEAAFISCYTLDRRIRLCLLNICSSVYMLVKHRSITSNQTTYVYLKKSSLPIYVYP